MRIFKSALRKRMEDQIALYEKKMSDLLLEKESRKIKETLNPKEHLHYIMQISSLNDRIKLLKQLL